MIQISTNALIALALIALASQISIMLFLQFNNVTIRIQKRKERKKRNETLPQQ